MWAILIVSTLVALYARGTEAVCGNPPPVWRNNNITCPERAICADVFRTPRDWLNGTRCEEERVLIHCLCNGDTVCPYTDEAHLLYASALHLQYTCQPKCQLPYCGNVRQRPVTNGRVSPIVAQTLEQEAPEFANRNYFKMSCRCPRNHVPVRATPGSGTFRSVQAHSHMYDFRRNRYITQYVCSVRGNENLMQDPCGQATVVQQ